MSGDSLARMLDSGFLSPNDYRAGYLVEISSKGEIKVTYSPWMRAPDETYLLQRWSVYPRTDLMHGNFEETTELLEGLKRRYDYTRKMENSRGNCRILPCLSQYFCMICVRHAAAHFIGSAQQLALLVHEQVRKRFGLEISRLMLQTAYSAYSVFAFERRDKIQEDCFIELQGENSNRSLGRVPNDFFHGFRFLATPIQTRFWKIGAC